MEDADDDETLEERLYDLYSNYYRLELNSSLELAKAEAHDMVEVGSVAQEISKVVQVNNNYFGMCFFRTKICDNFVLLYAIDTKLK